MTDKQIIEEAIKLVDDGVAVTFPVKGYSMLPFIIGGKESVVLSRPNDLKVGYVVLAWADNSHYVVHRIISISGNNVVLMGDGNLKGVEHCSIADVKAVATYVVGNSGKRRPLQSDRSLAAARVWYRLRPVRRWILAIYRRVVYRRLVWKNG